MENYLVLILAILIAFVYFVGSSSSNKGKIEGTKWASEATTNLGKAIPPGALQLEFHGDGTLVYLAGAQTFTRTYSIGKGDRVTLNLDHEIKGTKQHLEKVVIVNDRLTMTDGDGTECTFSKVN
jgi:hypothetical protein